MHADEIALKLQPFASDLLKAEYFPLPPAEREKCKADLHKLARRLLGGDYEQTPLLSLPPERVIRGDFPIGNILFNSM